MIQNYNIYKVLNVFLKEPLRGFNLREISRKIKLGLPSVSNYIKNLEKENLIIKKKENRMVLWYANREEREFKIYKIFDNLLEIENSKIIDFLEEEYNYPTIILFGSYAIGENTEKSDIDLCVISEKKKEIDLKKFEKKIKKEIQVFLFKQKEFSNMAKKNKELFNNIVNGIILGGLMKL